MIRRCVLLLALTCVTAFSQERMPWTTSRIQGTPEPPPPYVVERLYPGLTFKNPLDVTPLPGTDRLVVLEEGGRMFSFVPGVSADKADLFGELSAFDPEISRSYALTFHPRFTENRFVFMWANYDLKGADNRENGTQIIRFRVTETPPQNHRHEQCQGHHLVACWRSQWRQLALWPGWHALHLHGRCHQA